MQTTTTRLPLLCWIACGLSLLAFRFAWNDISTAKWIGHHLTYWMTWLVFLGFAYEAFQRLRHLLWPWLKEHRLPILTLLSVWTVIQIAEPHFHKVLADEPVHAAVAQSMHLYRKIAMPYAVHLPYDVPTWEASEAPYRGHLFSFLVAFTHDLTGYRIENTYVVNGIVGLVLLVIIYSIGVHMTAKKPLSLAVSIAFASAPIFGQVMCSGSYDLINLLFLSLLIQRCLHLNTDPNPTRSDMRLLLFTCILLAYSRPESIIYYAIPVSLIIFIKYTKSHELKCLYPEQIAGLWLFIPTLCTQIILLHNRYNLTQGQVEEDAPIVSVNHFIRHWGDTFAYFSNASEFNMSSVLLFVIGIVCAIILAVTAPRHWLRSATPHQTRGIYAIVAIFLLIAIGLYSMIMSSFWGGPTVPVMTRFTLPLWMSLCMIIYAAYALNTKPLLEKWISWSPAVSLFYFVAATIPTHARADSIKIMYYGYENHKALEWIDAHDDKKTLYIGNSSVQFIARNHPAVSTKMLTSNIPAYIQLVKSGIIGRILFIDYQIINPLTGNTVVHERNWRDSAPQWKRTELWSHEHSIGMRIVIESLDGVTFNGKYYDLTTKQPQLPRANTVTEMQQKVFGSLPTYIQE